MLSYNYKTEISLTHSKKYNIQWKNRNLSVILCLSYFTFLNYFTLLWMATGKLFISKKSFKTSENTIKIPKCMLAFTFFYASQWARLEPLLGRFWTMGLMFDTLFLFWFTYLFILVDYSEWFWKYQHKVMTL